MKKKHCFLLVILLIAAISVVGCRTDDNDNIVDEDQIVIDENPIDNFHYLTSEELSNQLAEAVLVEIKNTDNEVIGGITDREKITILIEKIFEFKVQDNLTTSVESNDIIGPINFFFSNGESYFGLVKEDHIFIEGYYFLLEGNQLQEFMNIFTVLEEPVGEN